jgi:cyclic pyranopterin phosphate synthase
MPADGGWWNRRARLPSLERVVEIAAWIGRHYPLEKVRITGGEPTLRRGLPELVRMLASLPQVPEVAMTTNGLLLKRLAPQLAAAGLDRVNISLDTLDPERYSELTRGGRVGDAVAGIHTALDVGLVPIRLNSVLRRSSWRDDVPALLDFALEHGVEPRFLELMHTGTERAWAEKEFVSAPEVQRWVGPANSLDDEIPVRGTARRCRIKWKGAPLTIGWITPVSRPFCENCNRLRLDAHGRLRRCLMDPETLPLLDLLDGDDQPGVARRVAQFLNGKVTPNAMHNQLPMVSLGG